MHLTRKRIIATAMDLIERDGVDALSMYRLASVLGCGVVAVYSYMPSKATLLDGVADAVTAGFELPPATAVAGDWPGHIRALAMAFRAMVRAHPRCAMVAVHRRPPSVGTLRSVEHALATLSEAGFAHEAAAGIIRAVVAYVLGSVLGDTEVAPALDGADDARRRRLRPGEYPHLVALAAEHAGRDADADFEFGLDLLLRSATAIQATPANPSRLAS